MSFSNDYWNNRYDGGGNSGDGSYGKLAEYKAEIVNEFIKRKGITSVIDLGCGDGNQAALFEVENYIGYDISEMALKFARANNPGKVFKHLTAYDGATAELVLSLDIIFHLSEDETFNDYMQLLFAAASKYVIIYSTNDDNHENNGISQHIKHRNFGNWIRANAPNAELIEFLYQRHPYNGICGSYCDFFIYQKY